MNRIIGPAVAEEQPSRRRRSRVIRFAMFRSLRLLAITASLVVACRRQASPPAGSDAGAFNHDTTLGTAAPDSAAQAAARFAQAFYAWYERTGERYRAVVSDSPALFAPALLAALRRDNAAQQATPDQVTGLDWDPFLDTQDPCVPYQVTGATRRGDTILVAVNGMCVDRAPQSQPDVIAEVRFAGGRWVFADFRHVGSPGSLLEDLVRLRGGRGADSAPPSAGARR